MNRIVNSFEPSFLVARAIGHDSNDVATRTFLLDRSVLSTSPLPPFLITKPMPSTITMLAFLVL